MEFVTQLWCYKSKRFFLGIECPELIKNHVWLFLIIFKMIIVGCSLTHLTQPDIFSNYFISTPKYNYESITEQSY